MRRIPVVNRPVLIAAVALSLSVCRAGQAADDSPRSLRLPSII